MSDPERIWPICSAIASIWEQKYSNWTLGELVIFLAKQERCSLLTIGDDLLWKRLKKEKRAIMRQIAALTQQQETKDLSKKILNHIEF